MTEEIEADSAIAVVEESNPDGAPALAGVTTGDRSFPVVGVGASAGGLDAFTQLLKHLPADSGMAIVLIQHLDPTHPSLLREALARATEMTVIQPEDGTPVRPNRVYVIPPDADLAIKAGLLTLVPRTPDRSREPELPGRTNHDCPLGVLRATTNALSADHRDRSTRPSSHTGPSDS